MVNARFVKPLDETILADLARQFTQVITVEENAMAGGFGSAVSEALERIGAAPCQRFIAWACRTGLSITPRRPSSGEMLRLMPCGIRRGGAGRLPRLRAAHTGAV